MARNDELPTRQRRRPQLLPARGHGNDCVLVETTPCIFEQPTPCDSVCWFSEWDEWSECALKQLEFGAPAVMTSYRERHVFNENGGACQNVELKQYDESRCIGKFFHRPT